MRRSRASTSRPVISSRPMRCFPGKPRSTMSRLRSKSTARRAARRWSGRRAFLAQVGLGAFSHRQYPHMLSGGQRKRVGLAQVLIRDPKILLMDEPFGPLDAQTRQIMGNLLLELWSADRKGGAVCDARSGGGDFARRPRGDHVGRSFRAHHGRLACPPRAARATITEVKLDKAFHDLHREIWDALKDEVMKGYAQSTQIVTACRLTPQLDLAGPRATLRAPKTAFWAAKLRQTKKGRSHVPTWFNSGWRRGAGGHRRCSGQGRRRVHADLAELQGWRTAGNEVRRQQQVQSELRSGENVRPPLNWANPPAGTKSYALLMFDPEGRPPVRRQPLGRLWHSGRRYPALPRVRCRRESKKYVGGTSLMKLPHYSVPAPLPARSTTTRLP